MLWFGIKGGEETRVNGNGPARDLHRVLLSGNCKAAQQAQHKRIDTNSGYGHFGNFSFERVRAVGNSVRTLLQSSVKVNGIFRSGRGTAARRMGHACWVALDPHACFDAGPGFTRFIRKVSAGLPAMLVASRAGFYAKPLAGAAT